MHLGFQISVFALAVFGLFCLIKIIWSAFFSSRAIAVSVVVKNGGELAELEDLLEEAVSAPLAIRQRQLCVLIPQGLEPLITVDSETTRRFERIIEAFGATVYVISDSERL